MNDPHQVNRIIGTAICNILKDGTDHQIGAEEAKLLGKCVVEALNNAVLQIVAADLQKNCLTVADGKQQERYGANVSPKPAPALA
jgi:hypothetical protein